MPGTTLLILLFIVSNLIAVVWIIKSQTRRRALQEAALRRLAEVLGLDVSGGEPIAPNMRFLAGFNQPLLLSGFMDGRSVRIRHYTEGSGKNQIRYFECALQLRNPAGIALELSPEGKLTQLGKTLGMKEIETGHAGFDAAWFVRSSERELAALALFPEIIERLHRWHVSHQPKGKISCSQTELRFFEVGEILSPREEALLTDLLPILLDWAQIIDAFPPNPL